MADAINHYCHLFISSAISWNVCYNGIVDMKQLMFWFSLVSAIGAVWGVIFSFFGLSILPVSDEVLMPWGNGVYGSTLIGLSVTLFFVGRHAFRNQDTDLMKVLLYGIASWLIIEALFSLYYQVWFNVVVDAGILVLLCFPLVQGIRSKQYQS